MKHLKNPIILSAFLSLNVLVPGFAQDSKASPTVSPELLYFGAKLRMDQAKKEQVRLDRASKVIHDNEYAETGHEKGVFLPNPLFLNGRPLEYGDFNVESTGELTVMKGATTPGETVPVPFYVYLRRNGAKVLIPAMEKPDPGQFSVDISRILEYSEPGDLLIIEAVRKEDGAVKRILRLLGGGGC